MKALKKRMNVNVFIDWIEKMDVARMTTLINMISTYQSEDNHTPNHSV